MPGENNTLGEIDFPGITTHHLSGVQNNPISARIKGYSMGSAPYVSFADPDDKINVEAFSHCLSILENNQSVGAVYTNSILFDVETGESRTLYRNHVWSLSYHASRTAPIHPMVLIRREVLNEAISKLTKEIRVNEILTLGDQILYAYIAAIKPWQFLNINGYTWNRRNSGNHSKCNRKLQIDLLRLKKRLFFDDK